MRERLEKQMLSDAEIDIDGIPAAGDDEEGEI